MFKAYAKYWRKATQLSGYSSRSDYWWVFLVNSLIFLIVRIVEGVVSVSATSQLLSKGSTLSKDQLTAKVQEMTQHPTGIMLVVSIIVVLISLAILLPNISLTSRRLRDAAFPTWIAFIFGAGELYSLAGGIFGALNFAFVGFILLAIELVTYILCIFPSKYRDEEDDDSRNYD